MIVRSLDNIERITDDRIIGIYKKKAVASITILTRDNIMSSQSSLSVPAPEGDIINDSTLVRKAIKEFQRHTKVQWLKNSAVKNFQVVNHLVSAKDRQTYASDGWITQYDKPGQGYYQFAFEVEQYHIHGTGQIGEWLAIFIGMPLKRDQALEENVPRKRPVDALQILKQVFPDLASLPWKYSRKLIPDYIYDLIMETSKADLRAGVRSYGPLGDEERYLYGVRINMWSKQKYGFCFLS